MRRAARRRRYLMNTFAAFVSGFLIVWTLIPLYNMVMVALRAESDVFSDHNSPGEPRA